MRSGCRGTVWFAERVKRDPSSQQTSGISETGIVGATQETLDPKVRHRPYRAISTTRVLNQKCYLPCTILVPDLLQDLLPAYGASVPRKRIGLIKSLTSNRCALTQTGQMTSSVMRIFADTLDKACPARCEGDRDDLSLSCRPSGDRSSHRTLACIGTVENMFNQDIEIISV